jgi:hypothetical protein
MDLTKRWAIRLSELAAGVANDVGHFTEYRMKFVGLVVEDRAYVLGADLLKEAEALTLAPPLEWADWFVKAAPKLQAEAQRNQQAGARGDADEFWAAAAALNLLAFRLRDLWAHDEPTTNGSTG